MGTADSAATVTVNNQATYRRGDYFHKELTIDNSAGPVSAQVNVVGVKNSAGPAGEDVVAQQGGNVYVAQASEAYTYDADGNLASDGRWNYTWDAENRLVSLQAISSVPAAAKRRLEFAYDYMGRRVQKTLYVWNGGTGSYQLQSTSKFIYDGWNLVAELDASGTLVRSHVWGQDLSGTLQGAGGVGGLLLSNDVSGSHIAGYDGNGNVTVLVNASTGTISASYEYDPFGNSLRVTGEASNSNSFRFSTKYTDQETGLVYYGLRFYNPQTGAWLSRDPIEEEGSANLYGFVGNGPIGAIDILGLELLDLYHETSAENAASIVRTGFRASEVYGDRWLATLDAPVAGTSGKVSLTYKLDVNSVRDVPECVIKEAEKFARAAKGDGGMFGSLKYDYIRRWVKGQPEQAFRMKPFVRGAGHTGPGYWYILKESAWRSSKATLARISGEGSYTVFAAFASREAKAQSASWAASARFRRAATALRIGGRLLVVVGIASSIYEIYTAEDHFREIVRQGGGWAGAAAGAWTVGRGGAMVGGLFGPKGAIIGGGLGAIGGGIGGYFAGEAVATAIYDWIFSPGYRDPLSR